MRKSLLLSCFLLLLTTVLYAQDCPFHVQFKTIGATCYNNGKVVYALFDDDNNIMDSTTTYQMHDFDQVRIYYITDTTHYGDDYAGGWDTLTLDYGKYTVGVQASCKVGAIIEERNTDTTVEIALDYTKPKAGALLATATSDVAAGRHPTLICQHTGRIQLKIEDGRLPFIVTMTNVGGGSADSTYVFSERGTGSDNTKFNYKDYFTIDSLKAGTYRFSVVDGCGYGLPVITQQVDTMEFTKFDHVNVYASSGNFDDYNVVKVKATLNDNYKPYYANLISNYAQYRFTHSGGLGSTAWRHFPETSSKSVVLYDTVPGAARYCDIWEKDINLEYKVENCGSFTSTVKFIIYEPNKDPRYGYYYSKADTVTGGDADSASYAKYGNNGRHVDGHWIHYVLRNETYENAIKGIAKYDNVDPNYRFHYTHPLVWEYFDVDSNKVVKLDTVEDITAWSKLCCPDVISFYRPFVDSALVVNMRRTLKDANGCDLYSVTGPLEFRYWAPGCGYYPQEWNFTSQDDDSHCRGIHSITYNAWNTSNVIKNSIQVSLVESPLDNFYNFDATYNASTKESSVVLGNEFNTANLSFGHKGALSVSISQPELPSGCYQFRFRYKYFTCSGDTVLVDTTLPKLCLGFYDSYRVEKTEEPVFSYEQSCSALRFTYTAGNFRTVRSNTRSSNGYQTIIDEYSPNPARFKIIKGPAGGYDNNYYRVGDPILVSLPGTYIVRMEPEKQYCDSIFYYDTVINTGGTVSFDYAMAVLCDRDSTKGNIYVHAIEGTPPYTYTLFREADKQGGVLKTYVINDESTVCIDSNRSMTYNVPLSCMVTDACGSYFYVNIYPSTLADMQKLWFDNGLSRDTVCRGSSITIHAMKISNILSYEWTGPNGFTSTSSDPSVFISDTTDGWYKVTIKGTGCTDATDSIYLVVNESPSLKIELSSNDSICPGSDMVVRFVPSSPYTTTDSIDFTVAFANSNGVEYRSYRALSGDTITDTYASTTEAHIYTHSIYDGRCEYTVADDTVLMKISRKLANSCLMLTTDTNVCFNEDARLWAKANLPAPYTIRWYSDYELTHLLKEDLMTDDGWSHYDTSDIKKKTFLYVQVDADGYCPTVYGLSTQTLVMQDKQDTTIVLKCGESYRLYDSGGPAGFGGANEWFTYRFVSEDGKPVSLHFDSLNMTNATLLAISGNRTIGDSIIYKINSTDNYSLPDLIVSRGDTLTLSYMGNSPGSNWSAIVERAPGVAIADPWPKKRTVFHDYVCQSHANNWLDVTTLENPSLVYPSVVKKIADINNKIKSAGTYLFSGTFQDVHGCDSIVDFFLTVEAPQQSDTTVVTTNMHGGSFTWHDSTYTQSGHHVRLFTVAGGCDSLDVLHLIILQIDTSSNDMCVDTTTTMGITVTEPDMSSRNSLTAPKHKIGDVLCSDGEQIMVLDVDSVLLRPDLTLMGVVFHYTDTAYQHGLAVALNGSPYSCRWSDSLQQTNIHGNIVTEYLNVTRYAIFDMNGYSNTIAIKNSAVALGGIENFVTNAPAAYYCYYYDHNEFGLSKIFKHSNWYLPSTGEISILFAQRMELNTILQKLSTINPKIEILKDASYWTSTEGYSGTAWRRSGSDGSVYNGLRRNAKAKKYIVRPVISF